MSLLKKIKHIIEDESSIIKYRLTPKAFTRVRCLGFSSLVFFLLRKGKSSLQFELDEYFSEYDKSYTKSALSQHRAKLNYEIFTDINKEMLNHFYSRCCGVKKWKGHRLIGIDGSTMQLPTSKELENDFGTLITRKENNKKVVLASLSQAFDVLNLLNVDVKVEPYGTGELSMAEAHLAALDTNDLLLMDRAYACFWFMSVMISQNRLFVIRLKEKRWLIAKQFLKTDKKEEIVTIHPRHGAIKKCNEKEVPSNPLSLRIIRVEIKNGDDYVLITNLMNTKHYTAQELSDLYRLRWPVEESYKHLKLRGELENLSGKSTLSVKQDVYRIICRANFSQMISQAMTTNQVEYVNNKRKKRYQLNRCQAYRKSRNLIQMIKNSPIQKWLVVLRRIGCQLIQQLEIIRPDRKVPIHRRFGGRPVNFMAYKP